MVFAVFYRNRFEVHYCLLSLFRRKNRQIMTSKIASVNHHFITYSGKVSAISVLGGSDNILFDFEMPQLVEVTICV